MLQSKSSKHDLSNCHFFCLQGPIKNQLFVSDDQHTVNLILFSYCVECPTVFYALSTDTFSFGRSFILYANRMARIDPRVIVIRGPKMAAAMH